MRAKEETGKEGTSKSVVVLKVAILALGWVWTPS